MSSYIGITTPTGVISATDYHKMKLENLLENLMKKYDINKDKALDEYEVRVEL